MNDSALIIGAGIGGLTAGALLAKRGWKVVMLEQSSRIGGCCGTFTRSGFKFDVGPTFFPDLLWGGLDLVLRQLGLDLNRIFLDPFSQVCLPGHRIGLHRKSNACREEWAREFPEVRDEINGILRELMKIDRRVWQEILKYSTLEYPPLNNGRKRTDKWTLFVSFLWMLFGSKRLKTRNILLPRLRKSLALAGFDLQTLFWGQTDFMNASLAYSALVMGLPFIGGFNIKGGSGYLCNRLCEYILSHRGEVRLNCHVKEILVRKREAVGLKLDCGEVLEGRCYIANTTPWGLYEGLLPDEPGTRSMLRMIHKVPYPNAVFSLFLGIKQDCIPSQMCHEVMFIPGGDNGEDIKGPFFIAMSPVEDQDRAPEGCRAMTVFQYTPAKNWNKGEGSTSYKGHMEAKTIKAVKGLIPFLDEGLLVCESATPLTYERFTARPGGMVKGVPQIPAVFYNNAFSEFTCYDHLYLAGDCITPGLGVEGVCRAALRLADRICHSYD